MGVDVDTPAFQDLPRTIVAGEGFFRMSLDEMRQGLRRSPDDSPRVSFQDVAMSLGLLFFRQRLDVDRVVEEFLEPYPDFLFAQTSLPMRTAF